VRIEERLAGSQDPRTNVVSAFAHDYPNIVLGGVPQFAYWCDHVYAVKGEPVAVAVESDPNGGARNTVIGRIGRPGATEGTVLSADGTKALVSVGAEEVAAAYNSDLTLTGGDTVRLLWQGRVATVLVKLTSYVAPPADSPGTTAAPPNTSAGELSALATDSATWVPTLGAWNRWAAQNQNVYQGTYGGSTMYGAWFYNGFTKQLAGATLTDVLFRVPKRFAVGSYNSAGDIHIYVHTSDNRPAGDVARVLGPYSFTIPPNYNGGSVLQDGVPAGFVRLPIAAGTQLVSGGGISITGSPYMGFAGKAEDPSSGQLLIPWSR
jgi:hypothetical protein